MDPFSALSIATAVVQFVEFGTKLGQRMLVMYDANRLDPLDSFEVITKDLDDYAKEMLGHLRPMQKGREDAAVNANAEAIEKLLMRCQLLAKDLLEKFNIILNSIRRLEARNPLQHVFQVTAGAARAVWNRSEIESTLSILESYRSQIVLRMLLMLDIRASASTALGEDLRENLSNITEVLAVVQERQRLATVDQTDRLVARMNESDAVSRRAYEDVVAAVLTLRNGETKLLSPTMQASVDEDGADSPAQVYQPGGSRKLVQFKSAAMSTITRSNIRDMQSIEARILDSLYFRQMLDRLETVKMRHDDTYEWIFCDPAEAQKPWDDFADWVANGSGCYWVCGKAGSGKSTLMKFVYEDPRLATLLHKWAGSHELKRSSFFFWGLGYRLQKSQEGLLRGMLHDLLSQNPELIPHVMPELLSTVSHMKSDDTVGEPSLAELMRWFRRLLELEGRDFRFFFLIDGIDEYDGDAGTIVELVSSLSQKPHVKFLLSSRPIPVCVENFSQFPMLQLHELTRDDIRRYAVDTLRRRKPRHRINDEDLQDLTEILVEKSFGVFIWVELSVLSLIRGLENRDNMEELQRRLEELPSDLADLYAHMLKRMSPLYMQQAARLFRVAIAAMVPQSSIPLPTLQVSFLDMGDSEEKWGKYDLLTATEIPRLITKREELERSDYTAGRIRSRCCGLLETRRATSTEQDILGPLSYEYPCVDFLHRTVVEFLTDPEVWKDITKKSGPYFTPENNLFYSCVRICLAFPTPAYSQLQKSLVWNMGAAAMMYGQLSERCEKPIPALYLRRLDAILTAHWRATKELRFHLVKVKMEGHWADNFGELLVMPLEKGQALSTALDPIDFGSIAVSSGLRSFIQDELSLSGSSQVFRDAPSKSRHLYHAVDLLLGEFVAQTEDIESELELLGICKLFLEHRADPDARFDVDAADARDLDSKTESRSAWMLVLHHAASNINRGKVSHDFSSNGRTKRHAGLVLAFLAAGADVNERIVWRKKRYRDDVKATITEWSAMAVLDTYYRPPGVRGLLDGGGQADSFTSLLDLDEAPSSDSPLKSFHEGLMKQMADSGAKAREWQNDVLVRGPPEAPNVGKKGKSSDVGGQAKRQSIFRHKLGRLFKK